jgi:hypothetical protein
MKVFLIIIATSLVILLLMLVLNYASYNGVKKVENKDIIKN